MLPSYTNTTSASVATLRTGYSHCASGCFAAYAQRRQRLDTTELLIVRAYMSDVVVIANLFRGLQPFGFPICPSNFGPLRVTTSM